MPPHSLPVSLLEGIAFSMLAHKRPMMGRVLAWLLLLCSIAGVSPASTMASPAAQGLVEPQISARAAIVVDYATGRILYSKAMHDRLPPASTTKIMTAILAMENGNLDETITVTAKDITYGSKMGLKSGERQTMRNLLYGLLIPSGNDAALTIARTLASQGSAATEDVSPVRNFAAMMNRRVAAFGLQNTNFVNPHGLDTRGQFTSAYDLASLTWYAMQFPLFNEIVKQDRYDAPGHPLKNTNKMLEKYAGAQGVKTGYTRRAGLCLVTSATRNGRKLISVVLNAPKWVEDSSALLDYGFARLDQGGKLGGLPVLPITRRGAASLPAEPSAREAPAELDPVARLAGLHTPQVVLPEFAASQTSSTQRMLAIKMRSVFPSGVMRWD